MAKKIVYVMITIAVILLAGCTPQETQNPPSVSPQTEEYGCEQVVKDFTGGKAVEFERKIDADEKDSEWKDRYLGHYVFKDEQYEYLVDPNNLYICRINVISNEAWELLNKNDIKASTEEAISQIALDIFKKIESKFLVEGGEITTKITEHGGTILSADVKEIKDGIPTGNCASISITKAGNFMGGLFLVGDSQHIENLTNEKDKIINFEQAAQIAVEEIKAEPKLAAENIVVDETIKDEMSTRDSITVRFIYLTFNQNGDKRKATVLVDVFSGKVIDVTLY